jgi:hypothetical protein
VNIYWLIKNYLTAQGGWRRKLTIGLLLAGILQASVPIAVAQSRVSGKRANFYNQASYSYSYSDPETGKSVTNTGSSNVVPTDNSLTDTLGGIYGCGGALLPDYTGFSVGIYEPLGGPTGTELGELVSLTTTEVPDVPKNGVPPGPSPNTKNVNPYFIGNEPIQYKGVYKFLLDSSKGQLDIGKTYILVVNPPTNSIYAEQLIKLEILSNTNNIVE